MIRSTLRSGTLLATALLAAACTTTGAGRGVLEDGGEHAVAFAWTSGGGTDGTLTATVDDGRTYAGRYFQITTETRIERLEPLWTGWERGWPGWRHWQPYPATEFVKHYSGRVLANLEAADGDRMRCRIRLARPASGLAAGGTGRCQLSRTGETIEVTFDPR